MLWWRITVLWCSFWASMQCISKMKGVRLSIFLWPVTSKVVCLLFSGWWALMQHYSESIKTCIEGFFFGFLFLLLLLGLWLVYKHTAAHEAIEVNQERGAPHPNSSCAQLRKMFICTAQQRDLLLYCYTTNNVAHTELSRGGSIPTQIHVKNSTGCVKTC